MSPESPTPPPGESGAATAASARPGLAPVDDPGAGRRVVARRHLAAVPRLIDRERAGQLRRLHRASSQANGIKGADDNQADATHSGKLDRRQQLHHHRSPPAARRRPALMTEKGVGLLDAHGRTCSGTLLPLLLPVALLIGFFVWMQRRARARWAASCPSVGARRRPTPPRSRPRPRRRRRVRRRECAGRVAIRHAACDLIGREEAEPDQELVAEIRVTTREQTSSGCDGGSHDLVILNVGQEGINPSFGRLSRQFATSSARHARSLGR